MALFSPRRMPGPLLQTGYFRLIVQNFGSVPRIRASRRSNLDRPGFSRSTTNEWPRHMNISMFGNTIKKYCHSRRTWLQICWPRCFRNRTMNRRLIAKAIELLSPYSEMISGVSEIPRYSDEQLLANGGSSLLDEDMESVIRPLWRKESADKLVYVCFARSQTTGIIQRYRFQFGRRDQGWRIQFVQQGDVSPKTGETYGLE